MNGPEGEERPGTSVGLLGEQPDETLIEEERGDTQLQLEGLGTQSEGVGWRRNTAEAGQRG